jgi:hypothetical protein
MPLEDAINVVDDLRASYLKCSTLSRYSTCIADFDNPHLTINNDPAYPAAYLDMRALMRRVHRVGARLAFLSLSLSL